MKRLHWITGIVLILAINTASYGQCTVPDNLSSALCCQPVVANIPALPNFSLPGLGVCWDDCAPADQRNLSVTLNTPVQTSCGHYESKLDVVDVATATPVLNGRVVLDYTRTWWEVDPAGNDYQVWRFVAKADLSPTSVATPPPLCPVPSCMFPVGPYQTAFFYGYVDYVKQCGATSFRNSIVLYHACDFFIHKPGFSDRPGAFHPDRSYGIIAPHTTAAPFIPMNLTAPGGPLTAEATRKVATFGCLTEDPISAGALVPFANGCLCGPLSPTPAQMTLSVFQGAGTCVDPFGQTTDFLTQNLFPTLPWPHLVTTSIGAWVTPGVYPGNERAFVNEGLLRYRDACEQGQVFYDVVYGSTTRGGWNTPPSIFSPGITQNMIDMADNYSLPVGAPAVLPILGSIRPTDRLIYTNVP